MNAGVISIVLEQHGFVFHHAHIRVALRVVAQLIVNVHLDRVERTELGAITAVHTDRRIDEEVLGLGHRALGHRVFGALNPNTLRRTHFGANAATGALNLVLGRILHQKRDISEVLRHR